MDFRHLSQSAARFFVLIVVAVILCWHPIRAQEPQKPTEPEPQAPAPPQTPDQATPATDPNATPAPADPSTQKPPIEPVLGMDTSQYQIRELGKATNLLMGNSPLRWGPIYVASASAFFLAASGIEQDPTTLQFTNAHGAAELLRTDIVLDHIFGRQRIAVQYAPQITIINGQLQNDFTNTSLSIDTKYLLSPRAVLTLGDEFTSRNSSLLGIDGSISMDTLLGTTVTNPELGSASRYLSNQFRSSLVYLLGAHDQIIVSPIFTYEHTDVSGVPTSSYSYGASVAYDHAFTSRINAGLFYSAEERTFSSGLDNALYNTFGGSFSYHFAPTWAFSGTLGATKVGLTGGGSEVTTTGSASLSKSWRRSSAAITFHRGNRIEPFLTNRFATRYDATYNLTVTRRLSTSVSGSYEYGTFSSTSSVPETIYGTYITGRAAYRIRNTVSLVFTYAQRWQHGSAHEVILGGHNIYTAGIVWTAPQRPDSY